MQDRIRVADKNVYGDVPLRNQLYRTTRPVGTQGEKEHRERLKEITARIQAEQKLLKAKKISPHREGTAQEFDELNEQNLVN